MLVPLLYSGEQVVSGCWLFHTCKSARYRLWLRPDVNGACESRDYPTAAASGTIIKISVKKLMEKALPCFAPHREPSGRIRTRPEAALDRPADRHIFILNPLRNGDARQVAFARL